MRLCLPYVAGCLPVWRSVCLFGWLTGKQSLPVCLSVCLYGDYGCLIGWLAGRLAGCFISMIHFRYTVATRRINRLMPEKEQVDPFLLFSLVNLHGPFLVDTINVRMARFLDCHN